MWRKQLTTDMLWHCDIISAFTVLTLFLDQAQPNNWCVSLKSALYPPDLKSLLPAPAEDVSSTPDVGHLIGHNRSRDLNVSLWLVISVDNVEVLSQMNMALKFTECSGFPPCPVFNFRPESQLRSTVMASGQCGSVGGHWTHWLIMAHMLSNECMSK